MRPYFLTLGASILLATLSTTNIAVAKNPFPSKLYKIHIAQCSEHFDSNLKKVFLEGRCKEKFDEGIYVWGKPKSIGIVYYIGTYAGTTRGNVERDWILAGKNRPKYMTQAHTAVLVESEGCDVYPTPTKKRGFYPESSIRQYGGMAAASTKRFKIFVGSVEEVSENETRLFKKYLESDFNRNLIKTSDNKFKNYYNSNISYLLNLQRLCSRVSQININPQQVIPITGTATNENPLEIMYDEKILESFEKSQ